MSKDQGGTAFPASISNLGNGKTIVGHFGEEIPAGHVADYPGMTLRDYFAAAYLQGRVSDMRSCESLKESSLHFQRSFAEEAAAQAYAMADAMIAERAK